MAGEALYEPTDAIRTTYVSPAYWPWRALAAIRQRQRVAVVFGREGALVSSGVCPVGNTESRQRIVVVVLWD
jgi:hypothetical protein